MAARVAQRQTENDEAFLVDDDDEDTQANKFLSFRLGKESYGIGISHVTEIIEMQRISTVPDMPPSVKGVINLRGAIIPVMDLRLRFGMPERAYDDRTCMIVTELRDMSVGFIVDTVEEVIEIQAKDIEPIPRLRVESAEGRYVSGIGKSGDRVKVLLDAEKIVGDDLADTPNGGSNA